MQDKEKYEPKLKPTLENLDSIQKKFDVFYYHDIVSLAERV